MPDDDLKWATFPYLPLSHLRVSRGRCEAVGHTADPLKNRPRAAWIELLYEPIRAPDQTLLVRQTWLTCEACHTHLEANRRGQYHPLRESPPGMYRTPRRRDRYQPF